MLDVVFGGLEGNFFMLIVQKVYAPAFSSVDQG